MKNSPGALKLPEMVPGQTFFGLDYPQNVMTGTRAPSNRSSCRRLAQQGASPGHPAIRILQLSRPHSERITGVPHPSAPRSGTQPFAAPQPECTRPVPGPADRWNNLKNQFPLPLDRPQKKIPARCISSAGMPSENLFCRFSFLLRPPWTVEQTVQKVTPSALTTWKSCRSRPEAGVLS